MKLCGVYLLTHNATGRGYVGHSVDMRRRRNSHFSTPNYLIGAAIRKYGRTAFSWRELERCSSKSEAAERERHWIAELNTKVPHGFNLTEGGDGGITGWVDLVTPEQRERLRTNLGRKMAPEEQARLSAAVSKALKGTHLSSEHKAKLAKAQREHLARIGGHAPETRAKIAAAHRGKPKTSRGKPLSPKALAARYGRIVREETRNKISAANSGKKRSAEVRASIRARMLGTKRGPMSVETKRKIGAANRGKPKPASRRSLADLLQ